MILHCNYEELSALRSGAHVLLDEGGKGRSTVAAPPASRGQVEALLPRLRGDLSIDTLAEQERVEVAVGVIVECLRAEMKAAVVSYHPAHEAAVAAYFEYAHAEAVLERLQELGEEMTALIELVTGEAPTGDLAESFEFPE